MGVRGLDPRIRPDRTRLLRWRSADPHELVHAAIHRQSGVDVATRVDTDAMDMTALHTGEHVSRRVTNADIRGLIAVFLLRDGERAIRIEIVRARYRELVAGACSRLDKSGASGSLLTIGRLSWDAVPWVRRLGTVWEREGPRLGVRPPCPVALGVPGSFRCAAPARGLSTRCPVVKLTPRSSAFPRS